MKLPGLAQGRESRVEMIPLIDVVFLVLVAFIYASAFLAPKTGLKVDLPEASQGKTQDGAVVTITIKRDGALFLDKAPIQLDAILPTLVRAKQNNASAELYLRADRNAQLDPLVQVMDIARQADMASLTIATSGGGVTANAAGAR